MRQPILYAEQLWRNQRNWLIALPLFGVVFTALTLYQNHMRIDASVLILPAYVVGTALLIGLFRFYRWRSRVEVGETGLKVSNLLSTVVIGYEQIRAVRVQNLERHFEESRKRYNRPLNRALMSKPALFVRLKGDDPGLPRIRSKLGNQIASLDTIALPIPDPDAMQWEITSRLPEKTGVNLGGRRRRKRR